MRPSSVVTRSAVLASLGALLAGVVLASCGTALSMSSGSPTIHQLTRLVALLRHGATGTFEATYAYDTSGRRQTITIAQAPPKSLDKSTSGGHVIRLSVDTGTQSYSCTSRSCFGPATPVLGSNEWDDFDGRTFLGIMQRDVAAPRRTASLGMSFRMTVVGGQPSTCVTVPASRLAFQAMTWCVGDVGIITSWTAGTSPNSISLTLTHYTAVPSRGDFAKPSGRLARF